MKKILLVLCFIVFSSFVISKTTYAVVNCHGGDGTCRDHCDTSSEYDAGGCAPSPFRCCVAGANPNSSSCKTPGGTTGLKTAIGCIDTSNPNDFIKQILGLAVGIGGGIAFIIMLFGSFQIMASGGDPKGIQGGKETITSALTGLLLIVFSVFLLKLIGVDILGIPGLSK